jgi:hypothetical protein
MLTLAFALNAFEGIFHTKLMIAQGNIPTKPKEMP